MNSQRIVCHAEMEDDVATSTVVKKNSVLVLGATGTLGRQVVRQFLNAGYSVRCMIRNVPDRPFGFLLDWGATCVEGSLSRPESIPTALVGIHTVIDCATARPEESIYECDWEGKVAFIQACEKMQVQRYIFTSIKDCDQYRSVPLMNIKYLTEKFLEKSKLRYTVLRVSGYMQPLISQYALAILESQKVWSDDGTSPGVAYIDSQDAARMIAASVAKERTVGRTLTITGPKVWSSDAVIAQCEKLSGKEADVNRVSSGQLQATMMAAGSFLWSVDIAERLRFVEVNSAEAAGKDSVMSQDTYDLLGLDDTNTRKLDLYLGEYYRRVLEFIAKGTYEPKEGEVEKQEEQEKRLIDRALKKEEADYLPDGQAPEKEVSIAYQRDAAERLQVYFEDKRFEKLEGSASSWFGLTPVAEIINGRASMSGISLGLFTEWATGVSMPAQVDQIIGIFSGFG